MIYTTTTHPTSYILHSAQMNHFGKIVLSMVAGLSFRTLSAEYDASALAQATIQVFTQIMVMLYAD